MGVGLSLPPRGSSLPDLFAFDGNLRLKYQYWDGTYQCWWRGDCDNCGREYWTRREVNTCSPDCRTALRRKQTRERVARHRAAQR